MIFATGRRHAVLPVELLDDREVLHEALLRPRRRIDRRRGRELRRRRTRRTPPASPASDRSGTRAARLDGDPLRLRTTSSRARCLGPRSVDSRRTRPLRSSSVEPAMKLPGGHDDHLRILRERERRGRRRRWMRGAWYAPSTQRVTSRAKRTNPFRVLPIAAAMMRASSGRYSGSVASAFRSSGARVIAGVRRATGPLRSSSMRATRGFACMIDHDHRREHGVAERAAQHRRREQVPAIGRPHRVRPRR